MAPQVTDGSAQVFFVGAGPGDLELLTLKAKRLIETADVVVYTDSLVNPEIETFAHEGAEVHRSAGLTLDEICALMIAAVQQGKRVARVHTGDPAIFGAVLEQIVALERAGITWEIIPGVSSMFAAAAALGVEFTIPDLTQTVIVGRMEGRTPVPPREKLRDLAEHQATIVLFLSITLMRKLCDDLLAGGYPEDTPVAVVHKASWPDQKIVVGTLADITERVRAARIASQSIIIVGQVLDPGLREGKGDHRSKLYDPEFTHKFRLGEDRVRTRERT